jgi:hypothetical protein
LLRRTPDLAGQPVAQERAEWLARTVHALPDSVGTLSRTELATSLWDRIAHAVTAEYSASAVDGSHVQRPTDDFVRQSVRRYLRGDAAAAMTWADRAALRAATPHVGHGRAVGPHEHRLVLPASPSRSDGYQVQALIDSAVAQIGTNPDWQRVQKSVQLGADAPTVLINVRASRSDTASQLTVAFGNSGADRVPYEEVLRGGPDALLERVRAATDYEIEPLQLEPVGQAQVDGQARLSPLTDPAMVPPGGARPASPVQETAGKWTGSGSQQQTSRTLE